VATTRIIAVVTESDISCFASVLHERYGGDALSMANRRADVLLDRGDSVRGSAWIHVAEAIIGLEGSDRKNPSVPDPSSESNIISYYRGHALQCKIAAQRARTEKQRSALRKMIPAWSEFAAEHERTVRKCATEPGTAVCHPSVEGWM
jgi:hypothetical protein